MSKTLTTKEAMQALLDGKKLTSSEWGSGEYVYLNLDETLVGEDGVVLSALPIEGSWAIYEKPKPKKQVWQWRTWCKPKYGYTVENQLLTEEEAAEQFSFEFHYEKHAGPFEVTEE